MQTYTTITPKFQVHIPVSIRQKIGLKRHGRAIIRAEKKKIVIEPIKSSVLDLAGSLHHLYKKKPINIDRIRDYIDYSQA
jgi:bifunctional DNA-binding transcriptional regulator/antitoxin component of YhaV-PrlF toxin-antitoxin module